MISFKFAEGQEGINKIIVASTEIFEKDATGKYDVKEVREERFTISQLEDQIAGLEKQKLAWDDQIAVLKTKIAEVSEALSIEPKI